MKYPIVVLEGNDMKMFESPADLNYLEAIDVRSGEYEAMDSEGCPLDLDVDAAGCVLAADRADGVPEPERLAAILRRHLALVAENPRLPVAPVPSDSASLSELIEAALPTAVDSSATPGQQILSWLKRKTSGKRPKIEDR